MDIEKIKAQAEKEISEENFQRAVQKYKEKLKQRKWWHSLMPFKVMIIRRENV